MEPMKDIQAGKRAEMEAFWKADLKTISLIDPSTHRLSFQRHASKNQSSLLPNQCSLAVETAYNTSLPRCAMLKQEFRAIDDMLQDTDNKDCLFIQRRYNAMILVMNVVRDIYHRLGTELAQDFKRIHRLIEKPLEHHSEKGPLGPFSVDAWHNRWLDNVVIAEKCERDLKAMHAQYVSAKKELQMISERMESSYQDSSQNSGPLTASSYVSLHNKVGMSAHNDQLLKTVECYEKLKVEQSSARHRSVSAMKVLVAWRRNCLYRLLLVTPGEPDAAIQHLDVPPKYVDHCRAKLAKNGIISLPERLVNHVRLMQNALASKVHRKVSMSVRLSQKYYKKPHLHAENWKREKCHSAFITFPCSMSGTSNPMLKYSLFRRMVFKVACHEFGLERPLAGTDEVAYTNPDLIVVHWLLSSTKKRRRSDSSTEEEAYERDRRLELFNKGLVMHKIADHKSSDRVLFTWFLNA